MATKFVANFGSGVVIGGRYCGVTGAFPRLILAGIDGGIASPQLNIESCRIMSAFHWPHAEHLV